MEISGEFSATYRVSFRTKLPTIGKLLFFGNATSAIIIRKLSVGARSAAWLYNN